MSWGFSGQRERERERERGQRKRLLVGGRVQRLIQFLEPFVSTCYALPFLSFLSFYVISLSFPINSIIHFTHSLSLTPFHCISPIQIQCCLLLLLLLLSISVFTFRLLLHCCSSESRSRKVHYIVFPSYSYVEGKKIDIVFLLFSRPIWQSMIFPHFFSWKEDTKLQLVLGNLLSETDSVLVTYKGSIRRVKVREEWGKNCQLKMERYFMIRFETNKPRNVELYIDTLSTAHFSCGVFHSPSTSFGTDLIWVTFLKRCFPSLIRVFTSEQFWFQNLRFGNVAWKKRGSNIHSRQVKEETFRAKDSNV